MAGSFTESIGKVGFLEECASYLQERGLDFNDLDLVTYLTVNRGHYIKDGDNKFAPYHLSGWAYRIKNKYGEVIPDAYLLRPVNVPEKVYRLDKETGEYHLDYIGKFRHIGEWSINWVSTAAECMASPTLMLHEKFTCAYLSVKHLGIPSIGLSGCHNWRMGGAILPELRDVLLGLPLNAVVYMCLDGDVVQNPDIKHSAASFKGYMDTLRPDVQVVFPMVPEGYGGWDDWAVAQDDIYGSWVIELNAQHVDVTPFLTPDLLINFYGLAYKVDKFDRPVILHTTSNYAKLVAGHPKWNEFVHNVDDLIYAIDNPAEPMAPEDIARKVEIWMTDHAFKGAEAERVSNGKILSAVREVLYRPERQQSMAHHHIRQLGGPVGRQAAYIAAQRMVTEGIKVVGPMTHEETVETMLRVFRDMVGMWSWDRNFAPQWFLAIVGPSNAGKSDFPRSVLRPLMDRGFIVGVSRLHYIGDKAKPEEMARVLKASLIGVLDEYNPPSNIAKTFEDQLLSITSERIINIRKMRENDPKPHNRNASVFLTTTDKNRQYLRSGKGEGAERRAITLEIVPHYNYEGKLSSNRQVIQECAAVLLRWGLEAWEQGYPGSATEYSKKYADQYLAEDDTLRNVGKMWVRGDIGGVLKRTGEQLFRAGTGDYRFSATQLYDIIYPDARLGLEQRRQILNTALELGAEAIGQARVNKLHTGGQEMDGKQHSMVDRAFAVKDWDAWCEALREKLGV